MAHYFPRSASSTSPNSPSRSRRWRTPTPTVLFEEQLLNSSSSSSKITTTSSHNLSHNQRSPSLLKSDSFTSRDKRDYSRELHASFTTELGLSVEEIICDEIDDILPKTDYTYARTASYSPRHSVENYCSPNMSRRKLRSSQPEFLSDDEEEFRIHADFNSNARVYSKQAEYEEFEHESSTKESQSSEVGLQRLSKVRGDNLMTSTPMDSYGRRQNSATNYYYDGILLRSGSRVKGVSRYNRNQRSNQNSESQVVRSGLETTMSDKALNSSHRHSVDAASQESSGRNFLTVTKTTTTTTTITNDLDNRNGQNDKKAVIAENLSERKLLLDESITEKEWNKNKYKHTNLSERELLLDESITEKEWNKNKYKHTNLNERERLLDKSQTEKEWNKNEYKHTNLNERERLLDNSRTEKGWNKKEYKLKHLYGLDYDEEISDVDDVRDTNLAATTTTHNHRFQKGSSFFSFFTTIITTVITTVTSTFTDGVSSANQPLAKAASKWIGVPGRWLLHRTTGSARWLFHGTTGSAGWMFHSIAGSAGWLFHFITGSANWLLTNSATFLLWDIDIKKKKRRGCCCCFLPLLLLLPLYLLAGYYTRDVQHNLGAYLSDSKQLLSSSWSYLWFIPSSRQEVTFTEHSSPVPIPVPIPVQTSDQIIPKETVQQVDMTLIYQYIQKAVAESAAANKDNRPVGLTIEQVQTIVRDLLASNTNEVKAGLEGQVIALKNLLEGDVTSLHIKIADLESQIKAHTQTQQTLTDNLNQAKASFEGTSAGKNAEWLAASMALDHKLLNLTQEVNDLSSQSAALTAMLTNCCRNNSDIVRSHVISILSQMSSDENSELAGLLAQMNGQYVDKNEFDQRMSKISEEIMKKVTIVLAKMEDNSNAAAETHTSIVPGINETIVKSIIEKALTQFSADRIGMPDFALESSGGSVISVRCSETFYKKTALVSIFGIPLWYTSNSPRTVIQPNVNPGECWAFKGHAGFIVFQLSHPIMPTGFTLEHIPRSLAPLGDISSAPKDFAVFGLVSESDIHGINLGNYTYLDNEKPIQLFSVQNGHPGIFQLIELRILNNHGNKDYTCVYRFRVHGQP